MSPIELAWRFWGERRKRHGQLRYLAWAVSAMISPHIEKKHQSAVSPHRLFLNLAGDDLDEDEVN